MDLQERFPLKTLTQLLFFFVAATSASIVMAEPPQHLPFRMACLMNQEHAVDLRLELATSPRQRRLGLMERTDLPDNGGMLFVYPEQQPADKGFWMYRTPLPLSIAYLDESGRIVSIRKMAPCDDQPPSQCPHYKAGRPFRMALEVPQGMLARHGFQEGARLILGPEEQRTEGAPCAADSVSIPRPTASR